MLLFSGGVDRTEKHTQMASMCKLQMQGRTGQSSDEDKDGLVWLWSLGEPIWEEKTLSSRSTLS